MKKHNDYFDMLAKQAACSVQAAGLLREILTTFKPETAQQRCEEMHRVEHAADEVRHDALRKLAREFITPIERDDLLRLIQILDDVTDAIDEVAINLYTFNVPRLPQEAQALAALMERCVLALQEAVTELKHFKKSNRLEEMLIAVNTLESESDAAYIEATRQLFTTEKDPIALIGVKSIYDRLESCCDLCEHAADVIENTVMNNT